MNKLQLMKSVKAAALVVALALGAGVSVHAMSGGPGHHPHRHGGPESGRAEMGRMLASADASEAQRKQIREIMDAAFKELKPQHEAMRELHKDSRKLLAAATIDAAAVEAKRVQIQSQHEAISKRMSQAMVEAAKVLSPEQRAKLAEQMAKREARRAERMKDRGPAARGGQ